MSSKNPETRMGNIYMNEYNKVSAMEIVYTR